MSSKRFAMSAVALFLALLTPRAIFAVGIVELFEWRFDDIAQECEQFLGPKGYEAVQVSPVQEHSKGMSWENRYLPMTYKIASRSGDKNDFREMCSKCKEAGVKIYVDVVLNNCLRSDDSYYRSQQIVFPFSSGNFHSSCEVNNYNDAKNVRDCETSQPDLDQSQELVRGKIVEFLNQLIDLGADGFRVDAAKHMWPADLQVIYSRLVNTHSGSRPFIYQEVSDYGGEAVKYSEYTPLGHVTEFKNGRELSRCFKGQTALKWLTNYGPAWNLMPSDKAVVFIDNHDTQRSDSSVLNYKAFGIYRMAVAFMLGWGYGKPKIMSSYTFDTEDQGPPVEKDDSLQHVTFNFDGSCNNGRICEHRWTPIAGMIGFANAVQGTLPIRFWDNGNNQITFCRGNKGFIAFNGDSYDLKTRSQTCLPAGAYCDVASGVKDGSACTGKYVNVNNDGTAEISVTGGGEGFLAIHINSKLCTNSNQRVSENVHLPESVSQALQEVSKAISMILNGTSSPSFPLNTTTAQQRANSLLKSIT